MERAIVVALVAVRRYAPLLFLDGCVLRNTGGQLRHKAPTFIERVQSRGVLNWPQSWSHTFPTVIKP